MQSIPKNKLTFFGFQVHTRWAKINLLKSLDGKGMRFDCGFLASGTLVKRSHF